MLLLAASTRVWSGDTSAAELFSPNIAGLFAASASLASLTRLDADLVTVAIVLSKTNKFGSPQDCLICFVVGSNHRPLACKASALPTELRKLFDKKGG